jgi:hypothetical protein
VQVLLTRAERESSNARLKAHVRDGYWDASDRRLAVDFWAAEVEQLGARLRVLLAAVGTAKAAADPKPRSA